MADVFLKHFRVKVEIEKVCLDCAGVYGLHIPFSTFINTLLYLCVFPTFLGIALQCPNVVQNVSKSRQKNYQNEHLFAFVPSFPLPGEPQKKRQNLSANI